MITYLKIKLMLKAVSILVAFIAAVWGFGRAYYIKNIKPFIK